MATPTINEIGKYYLAVSPKRSKEKRNVDVGKYM